MDRFRVLAVCTGNICRSPAVERLLAAELGAVGVIVGSAGTYAMVGQPMTASMATLVEATGADVSGFTARQLTASMIVEADLVLALTVGHRAEVVALHPQASHRTFTLRELARLAPCIALTLPPGTAPARLGSLVPLADAARAVAPHGESDDVEDPYGRGESAYRRSYGQLRPAVHAITRAALA